MKFTSVSGSRKKEHIWGDPDPGTQNDSVFPSTALSLTAKSMIVKLQSAYPHRLG